MSNRTEYPGRVLLRVVLYRGELFRLPRTGRAIRVRGGQAWATGGGRDTLVAQGSTARIASATDAVLVSAVGHTPLVLEVLGDTDPTSSSIVAPLTNPVMCE